MYQYFCSVGVNVGVKQKKIKKNIWLCCGVLHDVPIPPTPLPDVAMFHYYKLLLVLKPTTLLYTTFSVNSMMSAAAIMFAASRARVVMSITIYAAAVLYVSCVCRCGLSGSFVMLLQSHFPAVCFCSFPCRLF